MYNETEVVAVAWLYVLLLTCAISFDFVPRSSEIMTDYSDFETLNHIISLTLID